jgi:hypothetical protein
MRREGSSGQICLEVLKDRVVFLIQKIQHSLASATTAGGRWRAFGNDASDNSPALGKPDLIFWTEITQEFNEMSVSLTDGNCQYHFTLLG